MSPSSGILIGICEPSETLHGVSLIRWFIPADATDPRKPQRYAAFVSARHLNPIERHLQHQRRLHLSHWAKCLDGIVAHEVIELLQLLIREAGIGLADGHQLSR